MSADRDDYADETFEPDHAAEKLILQGQLDAAKQQIASLEASLRTARVAGRRQKASGDEPSQRAQSEIADDALAHSPLLETPYEGLEVMGDHVASGGFGCVYRASWNGCLVAVKRLFDPLITDELRAEFANEVRVLSRLRHPNIVQFLACCSKPPHLCIVTEFMARGSLYHVLYSSAVEMPRERQNTIIKQLAAALAYLHSIDIVHNDIKAPNVLVDEHFKTKLCDFGLARPVNLLGQMRAAGGTPNYIAPELWNQHSPSKACDIYSMGMVFFEIATREVPFDGLDPPVIRERVLAGQRPPLPAACPAAVRSLIERCWAQVPAQRPTAAQMLKEVSAW